MLLAYKRTCAKEALVIRLSRPHERAYHCVIAERFANTLVAYVVQHLLLGRLAAPQLNKHILWVPSRTLHELDAHLLKHHSCVVYVCVYVCVHVGGGCGVLLAESLKTRATCFIVWPSDPQLSPRLISQCVRLDICATALAKLSAGSFHHFGLRR